MPSAAKHWFTKEVISAGWISAITCLVGACWCLGWAKVTHSSAVAIVYPILPVALGCVAVGALNFRRWHSFRESMAACFMAVVSVYQLFGAILFLAVLASLAYGRAALYFLVLLTFWSVYIALYLAVIFCIAVWLGCAAGGALYGLSWLMRYVGQLGQRESGRHEPPRALRMVG
jgi:hypothetical protein